MGLQAILSCHQALFFAPVIKDVQGPSAASYWWAYYIIQIWILRMTTRRAMRKRSTIFRVKALNLAIFWHTTTIL